MASITTRPDSSPPVLAEPGAQGSEGSVHGYPATSANDEVAEWEQPWGFGSSGNSPPDEELELPASTVPRDGSLVAGVDLRDLSLNRHTTNLDAALSYAARGWRVFPLHTPDAQQQCSCRKRDCSSVGKHPRTLNGLKDATTDQSQIAKWWRIWPEANVGLVTGLESGLLVLDIDADTDGLESIESLEEIHGDLPTTWAVRTGGGGMHLFFTHPGGSVAGSAGKIASGLDIRADGGYVVAPPSLHVSGNRYLWPSGWNPSQVELAPVPDWLLRLIRGPVPRGRSQPVAHLGPIGEGQRNSALASLAGAMRRRGASQEVLEAALLADNMVRCTPPLPEPEVLAIARSISRYPSAVPRPVVLAPGGRGPVPVRGGRRRGR